MRKKHFLTAIFAFVFLLSAFNWSMEIKRERANRQRQEIETRAAQNGQLNLQLDAEVSTLDPQAAIDTTSFEVIACFMEGLYRIDQEGKPLLAAASGAEVLEEGRLYRFTLKQAEWSDGRPVTAEDFVYGWQRGIDRENGNEHAFLYQTAGIRNAKAILSGEMKADDLGIRAVDSYTLEVELEKPCPYFLSMLALPAFYPMNQEFYQSCGNQYGTSPETLLSNGAFYIDLYQPSGQEIGLTKNPHYHNADQVKIEKIHYQVIKDSQQAVLAYESGQLDMALLSGEQVEIYLDSPDFLSLPLGSLWYLSPNLQTPGLENDALRKALALAYDKETAAFEVMKDGSLPAYGAVPWKSMYTSDGQDFREGAEEYWKTDKEQALQYLNQAKTELGQEEFTFSLLIEDNETARNLGQFLQEEIHTSLPGVTLYLESVSKKTRLDRMAKGEYELGLSRWGADYPDPLAFLDMWITGSSFNYGGWSNKEYDECIASAKEEPLLLLPEERWEVLHQGERLVMKDAAIFPVCEKANGMLLRSCVKGASFHSIGVNRVWIDAWKEQGQRE